jgi:hypothetical protein
VARRCPSDPCRLGRKACVDCGSRCGVERQRAPVARCREVHPPMFRVGAVRHGKFAIVGRTALLDGGRPNYASRQSQQHCGGLRQISLNIHWGSPWVGCVGGDGDDVEHQTRPHSAGADRSAAAAADRSTVAGYRRGRTTAGSALRLRPYLCWRGSWCGLPCITVSCSLCGVTIGKDFLVKMCVEPINPWP